MPLEKLINYLDEHGRIYVVTKHSTAFTAHEVAGSAHVPGKEMVKTVIVKVGGNMKMVTLPFTHDIDFDAIKDALNASEVELASEDEFKNLFPDCEKGKKMDVQAGDINNHFRRCGTQKSWVQQVF